MRFTCPIWQRDILRWTTGKKCLSFKGFPPPARIARRQWLEDLKGSELPVVFLEAPHRIIETISDAESILVKRQIMIFRELTKINEALVVRPNIATGDDAELIEKGEFTVVICPADETKPEQGVDQLAANRLFNLLEGSGLVPHANIASSVAAALEISVTAAIKAAKKGKILAKRQSESAP